MALAAVLLLAGAGARLGHRPKCLLRRGGTPLLHHLLRALQTAGVGPVVAVLGHHAAAIGAALDGWPVTRVLNPDPQAAPADSLRLGLAALRPGHGGVLVALGDHPWIDAADLRALAQAYAQRPPGTDCVLPSHGGQPGHPRVFSPRACAEICALPGVTLSSAMPDDLVLAMNLDAHSAVVALTHDPKLDDLALMEALRTPAYYVGAMGSRPNNERRRERLLAFDVTPEEAARLRGPVGLRLGGLTPPEIALSIAAELTARRRGVDLSQPLADWSASGSVCATA